MIFNELRMIVTVHLGEGAGLTFILERPNSANALIFGLNLVQPISQELLLGIGSLASSSYIGSSVNVNTSPATTRMHH